MSHIPVLTKEVLQYLNPQPNENFIDCTAGEGGHAIEILKKTSPFGKFLGIDADESQIKNAKENLKEFWQRVILENDSYANLTNIVRKNRFAPVNGILLDLGYSSFHIKKSGRGFTFLKDETLDMRYSSRNDLTAEKIVNEWPEEKIYKILEEFGEEKFAKQIAKSICKERRLKKIKTTFELVAIVQKAIPRRPYNIHYATRTFQALRIAVNYELENLAEVLPQAVDTLAQNGKMAVISFHSLEDRIVKNFFKQKEKEGIIKILTKKPVGALSSEIGKNPMARSAKMRIIMKIK